MTSCSHARRFFYRQRLRVIAERPVVPVVERCLDCTAITRKDVPPDEIRAVMLSVAMLDADPWEGSHA